MRGSLLVWILAVGLLLVVGNNNNKISAFDADLEGLVVPAAAAAEAAVVTELEELRDKIASLESTVAEKIREVKSKDEIIAQKEKVIQEKSASIDTLQSELDSIQKKGAVDAQELVGKANARARELEKQVEKLINELETESKKRVALESQDSEAEKKVRKMELELEQLQKTYEGQNDRLKKTERALKVAEEELMRVQLDATSKSKELTKIHGAWLPPWLAMHLASFQEFAAIHWEKHGKPKMEFVLQKASEGSQQAQKWIEPHLETARTKWVPAAEERWRTFTTVTGPYVDNISTKTIQYYEASRDTVRPHIVKIGETVNPYIEEARKFCQPYIDQVASITKPHVEKVRVALDPHTKRALYAYKKFLETATTYHNQVQETLEEILKSHELSKAFATKELVWFMASALLALPILILYKLLLPKSEKPAEATNANHSTRRHKRRHADKQLGTIS